MISEKMDKLKLALESNTGRKTVQAMWRERGGKLRAQLAVEVEGGEVIAVQLEMEATP